MAAATNIQHAIMASVISYGKPPGRQASWRNRCSGQPVAARRPPVSPATARQMMKPSRHRALSPVSDDARLSGGARVQAAFEQDLLGGRRA